MPTDAAWALLDGAPDATLVVDRSGTIVYANRCTGDILRWPSTDLVGQSIDVLVPSEVRRRHGDFIAAFQRDPRSRMMGVGLELAAVRRDGERLPVEIALYPFGQGDSTQVIVSIRDITQRVRLDQQLADATARLAVVDERDRIARDLHDRVIQRLFASGLHLQASLGRPDQDERIATVIDEIDEAIKEIRTAIFTMHSPRGLHAGCEAAMRTALTEASRLLGHQPQFTVTGACAVIPEDLVVELVDVTRELLTNVAKHAGASNSWVSVDVGADTVTLCVGDDGVGMDPAAVGPGHGVRNVTDRATRRGGKATFAPTYSGGTSVTWTVPLP